MRFATKAGCFALGLALLGAAACGGPGGPPPPTTAERLNAEGLFRLERGELDVADDLFRRALGEAELVDDLQSQGEAWNNRGALAFAQGQCEGALGAHGAALRVHRLRPDAGASLLRTHANLGSVALACGQPDVAKRNIDEALRLAATLTGKEHEADVLRARLARAALRLEEGDVAGALADAADVARGGDARKDDALRAGAAALTGAAEERRGRFVEARRAFEEALRIDRERQAPLAVATDLRALARVAARLGDGTAAASYALRGARIARRTGDLAAAAAGLRHARALASSPEEVAAVEAELRAVEAALGAPRPDGGA